MKTHSNLFILAAVLIFNCLSGSSVAQPVNGTILADTGGVKVVKLWGTHQQRGYAYGYLLGSQITQMANGYVMSVLGSSYPAARASITGGIDFSIDSNYIIEAQAIIDGMDASATNTANLDYIDLLVSNCLLDVLSLFKKGSGMGCSSLMSWGDATAGTSLNGKSVLSRHLDWNTSSTLVNNQVIVIHLPSEPGEQKWALIGFAGMFSVLSGFNQHVGAFQHQMDDLTAVPSAGQHYLPIWFGMRKAIETSDFNGDGDNNVQDLRSVLFGSVSGFADGFIVTSLAEASTAVDSLCAMVAELAPSAPRHTFRYNSLPDSIPGDNLYAANYQIGRNSAMNFCSRYNNVKLHLGTGTGLDLDAQWNLMRDYSHLAWNLQFMQYSPEMDHLRLSVFKNGQAAYLRPYVNLAFSWLFSDVVSVEEQQSGVADVEMYPNPCFSTLYLRGFLSQENQAVAEIRDITGKTVSATTLLLDSGAGRLDVSELAEGIYFLSLRTESRCFLEKFVIIR